MLAPCLVSGIRRQRGLIDADVRKDVEALLYRRSLRRKRVEPAQQETLPEAVTEAYTAFVDVPEVREQVRQAMKVDRTPELQQILSDYRAMAVLLKRYEAMLEDDDETVMLLGGF